MEPALVMPDYRNSTESQRPVPSSFCPACGGPLLELRGFRRCLHCHYSICDGCESEPCEE
jgi:hypothetical protein